ncbi:hypothetical protein [Protaetiibacter larvae]|uniref:Uncharacterized protein n=1 Tax=Protaetiibacter larvae TaxID=2592654 RepID=A0A5C1Y8E6_9MICO|nr:hypothetical protein [Protaetiibacter larvae]QEO09217.1 hypothetical protein FLP23_03835 [Protaetiibacter larvae]
MTNPYPELAPQQSTPAPRRLLPPMGIDDWARDAAAAVLLLISLALPWTVSGFGISTAATRIDVLLVTILTVLGVGLTFLVRAGALGPISIPTVLGIRLAFAAPYGILVLVYLVLSGFGLVSGIGFAAAIGLAGTALIAQPRRAELAADPGAVPAAARIGLILLAVVGGAAALTTLLGVVIGSIQVSQYLASALVIILLIVVLLAKGAALLAIIGAVLRRSASGRIIGWGVSVAILPLVLISALSDWALTGFGVETLTDGTFVLWLALLAGALCSPALAAAVTPLPPLQLWFRVARDALTVAAVASGVLAVVVLLSLFLPSAQIGYSIAFLVALAAAAIAAVVARTRLLADPAGSRVVVLGLAGAVGGLGLVTFIVAIVGSLNTSFTGIAVSLLPYPFVLALLAPAVVTLVALTAPAAVRAYALENAPVHPGYPGTPTAAAAPAAPVPAPPAPAAAPAPAAVSRAADPATPAAELAELALDQANWVALAGNPSSYPDLVAYLREHGDAAVQQALDGRAG